MLGVGRPAEISTGRLTAIQFGRSRPFDSRLVPVLLTYLLALLTSLPHRTLSSRHRAHSPLAAQPWFHVQHAARNMLPSSQKLHTTCSSWSPPPQQTEVSRHAIAKKGCSKTRCWLQQKKVHSRWYFDSHWPATALVGCSAL